jgi:hypothetical protein
MHYGRILKTSLKRHLLFKAADLGSGSSESWLNFCQATHSRFPRNSDLHIHHSENLTPHTMGLMKLCIANMIVQNSLLFSQESTTFILGLFNYVNF